MTARKPSAAQSAEIEKEWSWLCSVLREALIEEDYAAAQEARGLMSEYIERWPDECAMPAEDRATPAGREAAAVPETDRATLLAETDELAANIRDQLGGWTLPPGQSAVVLAPGGHLSIVHTDALEGWARQVEQLRLALVASRETAARLNRRCQRAEAIADRLVASREQGARGRSLGRALANYAAARLAEVAREAIEGWEDTVTCVDISAAERVASGADLSRLRARLDVLTVGGERATVGDMASPHGPPPTKSLPSLLDGLISQAQEIARLHPKALHAAAIVALAEASRRECDGDGDDKPVT